MLFQVVSPLSLSKQPKQTASDSTRPLRTSFLCLSLAKVLAGRRSQKKRRKLGSLKPVMLLQMCVASTGFQSWTPRTTLPCHSTSFSDSAAAESGFVPFAVQKTITWITLIVFFQLQLQALPGNRLGCFNNVAIAVWRHRQVCPMQFISEQDLLSFTEPQIREHQGDHRREHHCILLCAHA